MFSTLRNFHTTLDVVCVSHKSVQLIANNFIVPVSLGLSEVTLYFILTFCESISFVDLLYNNLKGMSVDVCLSVCVRSQDETTGRRTSKWVGEGPQDN